MDKSLIIHFINIRIILLSITVFLFSCSQTKENKNNYANLTGNGSLSPEEEIEADEVSPDGIYRFDIAFAENNGASLGEKVAVIIDSGTAMVIYENDGRLSVNERTVFDYGKIMKHKSGVWIIGYDPADAQTDEFGGCSDGPSIIDFAHKLYWMC